MMRSAAAVAVAAVILAGAGADPAVASSVAPTDPLGGLAGPVATDGTGAAVPTTPAPTAPVPTTPPTEAGAADSESAEDEVVPQAPTREVSYAARLVAPVVVRRKPSSKARRITKLQPFGSWNGGPVVLQIAQVKTIDGSRWLRVRLPIRPNGATGWLPESQVAVSKLRYRITISRKARRLSLLRDGKRIGSTRVVIGASSTPTPAGSFAVLEVVRQPKGEVLGPWALHLTAHSNVLDDYGGGPGRVALHGRRGALLNDPLGSARSHGCVRMPNAFVARLAKVAVEGTPVVIS